MADITISQMTLWDGDTYHFKDANAISTSDIDDALDETSSDPVENSVIASAINGLSTAVTTNKDQSDAEFAEIAGDISTISTSVANNTQDISDMKDSLDGVLALLSEINPEAVEAIRQATEAVQQYIWAVVENSITAVYKGIKDGATLKDRQTATTWEILQSNQKILSVEGSQANASTLEILDELILGNYTLHINPNGGWSIT